MYGIEFDRENDGIICEIFEARCKWYSKHTQNPNVLVMTARAKSKLDYKLYQISGNLGVLPQMIFGMKIKVEKIKSLYYDMYCDWEERDAGKSEETG